MIAVMGIGTGVGKTLVSAILIEALQADYWKPIQCGNLNLSDTDRLKQLVKNKKTHFYPEAYSFRAPLSPHHASRLEKVEIEIDKLIPPKSSNILLIEGAGGLLVPLNNHILMIDLLSKWKIPCILVSKHYLGSINHTLLSVEALKNRSIEVCGIIFNGKSNPDTEQVIEHLSGWPVLGRLSPESMINPKIIKKYVKEWQTQIIKIGG